MTDQARIDELLLKWQEHHDRGSDQSIEDLTRDCPELASMLRWRIRVLRERNESFEFHQDLSATPTGDDTAPPGQIPAGPAHALKIEHDIPVQAISDLAFLRPSTSANTIGQLGPFLVSAKIGEGGMGWVFRAEDPIVKRHIALKIMKPGSASDAKAKARFLQEAQNAAAIDHDHIIPIYQVGEDNGVIYIAMPLLKGRSLESRLQDLSPISLDLILQVARETALGLAAAHERGVIHRDIKPANLWLEERPQSTPRVKILDFGLARPLENDGDPHTIRAAGTPGYMAPEQVHGEAFDARTDLFALGCVLYRLATRRPAFPRHSVAATFHEPPTPPATLNPEIPDALSRLIMSLLAKDPDSRPPSAQKVVALVDEIASAMGAIRTRTLHCEPETISWPSVPAPAKRYVFTWRWGAWIAIGAILVCVVGVVWWQEILHDNPATPESKPSPGLPSSLRADLEVYVWKKDDPATKRNLADPKVLPLQVGDYMQVIAKANRPAYFYLIQLESSGGIAPLYPWTNYEWDQRGDEATRDWLRFPNDPVKNAAPLTESPTGVEAILLFTRDTPLTPVEQARLKSAFDELPKPDKSDLLRGAIWLSERELPKVTEEADRGRMDITQLQRKDDSIGRIRSLLQGEISRLFADTNAVCYSFKAAK